MIEYRDIFVLFSFRQLQTYLQLTFRSIFDPPFSGLYKYLICTLKYFDCSIEVVEGSATSLLEDNGVIVGAKVKVKQTEKVKVNRIIINIIKNLVYIIGL